MNWLSNLPPIDVRSPAEHYGRDYVAAKYYGSPTKPVRLPGVWAHGWVPQHARISPVSLIGGVIDKSKPVWVARKDDELFLKNNGYSKAKAIGLPILYSASLEPPRIPDSLLVLPAHGLKQSRNLLGDDYDYESYIDKIKSLSKDFSKVVMSIHSADLTNNRLMGMLKKYNIEPIAGACLSDVNSLSRMRYLFESFEYVTSNAIGSALAYGACFGAKVSIVGEYFNRKPEEYYNVPLYRYFPDLLEPSLEAYNSNAIQAYYPFLFCNHPRDASNRAQWGRTEIGAEEMVKPIELQALYQQRTAQRVRRKVRVALRRIATCVPPKLKQKLRQESTQANELKRIKESESSGTTDIFDSVWTYQNGKDFAEEYKKIFLDETYRFVAKSDTPIIVDCTAGHGLGVKYFKASFPNASIIAFEGNEETFQSLKRNCENASLTNIELHNMSVVDALQEYDSHAKVNEDHHDKIDLKNDKISLKTIHETVSSVLKTQSQIDLLKIDLEDSNFPSFFEFCDEFRNIENLAIHCQFSAHHPRRLGVFFNHLEQAGFRLHLHTYTDCMHPFLFRPVRGESCLSIEVFGFRDPRFPNSHSSMDRS